MNEVSIYFSQNKKKIESSLLAILILMFLYGYYKNGLSYVLIDKISFLSSLKLFLFPIISITMSMLLQRKLKLSLKDMSESIILSIMMPPRFPILIFTILIILYYLSKNKFQTILPSISLLLIIKVMTCLISSFILKLDYRNIIELNNPYYYSSIDALFGLSVGNLGTTSILLSLIYFGVSMQDYYYKKDLVATIIAGYTLLNIFYACFYTHEDFLPLILNSHVVFASIIIAPTMSTSPAEKRYLYIFGIMIAILTFLLTTILHHQNGVYYALLIIQIIWALTHQLLKRI